MINVFEPSTKAPARRPAGGATRTVVVPTKNSASVSAFLARIGLSALLLTLLGLAIWYWPKFTNKPVNTVAITGDLKYTQREKIQAIIKPMINGGLLDVPLDDLRSQIELLAWVDAASVARVWPDGIEIDVVEQQPVARWGDKQLLNNRGQIFSPENIDEFTSWPMLAGPSANRFEVMEHYLELNRLLQKRGMQLVNLSQDARGAWTAKLSGNVELVFGRGKFIEKIQRLFVVYDQQLYQYINRAKKIDLRYRNGIAVQWREAVSSLNVETRKIMSTNVCADKICANLNHDKWDGSAVI